MMQMVVVMMTFDLIYFSILISKIFFQQDDFRELMNLGKHYCFRLSKREMKKTNKNLDGKRPRCCLRCGEKLNMNYEPYFAKFKRKKLPQFNL